MKYRFRVSKRPLPKNDSPLLPGRRRHLRHKGADTLRPVSRLPEPVEKILFEFGDMEEPLRRERKRKPRRKRLLPLLRHLATVCTAKITPTARWLRRRLLALRRPKRPKRIHPLPVLSGILCAALLVSVLSAAGVLLGLFGRYGRSFERVTVPDFVGKEPSSVPEREDPRFRLILQYEKNDLVEPGLVISQTPAAGVHRRIYSSDGACTVLLTVSRPTDPYTLEELAGKSRRDASLVLRNRGVSPKIREEYSDTVTKGCVLGTIPATGTSLSEGDTVILRVSLGKKILLATVPSLSGSTEGQAQALLRAASLKAGTVTYQTSSLPVGTVIAQEIAPGATLEQGTAVSFTVSAGDRFSIRTVPDLYGLSLTEAEATLRQVGLVVGSVYPVAGSAARGTVMTQSPLPGAPITPSTVSVDLYVIS